MTVKLTSERVLPEIISAHKRGAQVGMPSVCTAHPEVITACARLTSQYDAPLMIESTCNQVNQDGGYTGLTPAQFADQAVELVGKWGLSPSQLILGGDHLGPYPWRNLPAAQAMAKAQQMTVDYVLAGYSKLHLDTSMRCSDDPAYPLPTELIAQRSAELALAAEKAHKQLGPLKTTLSYIIGTEVPTPGGAQVEEKDLQVTTLTDASGAMNVARDSFLHLGLEDAWERVVAMVVQPGVEFGDETVHLYNRHKAAHLTRFSETLSGLIFEAHSTDYQTPEALNELVQDHFAILKVGPALTFAYREGILALEAIESALAAPRGFNELSHFWDRLETAMLADPSQWKDHYSGTPDEKRLARMFSFSDRARYYWTIPCVKEAVRRLFYNLGDDPLPLTLLSQYLPVQYAKIRLGELDNRAKAVVQDKVAEMLLPYLRACGMINQPVVSTV